MKHDKTLGYFTDDVSAKRSDGIMEGSKWKEKAGRSKSWDEERNR